MKRYSIKERNNYKEKLNNLAFYFSEDYWNESAYYEFSMDEINKIELATNELYKMCLNAVQYVIDNKLYDDFHINKNLIPLIEKSWYEDYPSFYGRFDLGYNGKDIKLLEFNADTPTSLYEASVVQWYWEKDTFGHFDQFNSIHEKLINYFKTNKKEFTKIYFTCVDLVEDITTTEYIRDTAAQAGCNTEFILITDIGWDGENFVDLSGNKMEFIFKLYPYEWLIDEQFGKYLTQTDCIWIEPAWKAILSNKQLLVLLWKLYPNNKYLLECYNEPFGSSYCRKPIYSREGANTMIVKNNEVLADTEGEYGDEGYVYQELFDLPKFDENYPIIGSWVIGDESAGIGIREGGLITNNTSKFVPHIINL